MTREEEGPGIRIERGFHRMLWRCRSRDEARYLMSMLQGKMRGWGDDVEWIRRDVEWTAWTLDYYVRQGFRIPSHH